MASMELQLISRIIRKGHLKQALEWGITLDDFLTDEGKHYFSHMLRYLQDPDSRGGQPGIYAFAQLYPNFEVVDDDITPTDAICKEVRKKRLTIDCRTIIDRVSDVVELDPIEAATQALRVASSIIELGYSKKTDVKFGDSLEKTLDKYAQLADGVDLSSGQWPWYPLQEETMGVQKDDYIIYYGRPKSMKSWVLAYHAAHAFDAGKKPLIYTKEMHPDNIFMRIAACMAKLPYREFRQAKLTAQELARVTDLNLMLKEMGSRDMVCLSGRDAPGGKDTVEWLHAKIEKHKPDIVFIDGIYLMTDSSGGPRQKDHERVRNISRGLRQMVLSTNIPLVGTIQANRQAAKNQEANLDEVAFSDSIVQDATVIARVINEKTTPTIALVIGGSREFTLHGFRIHGVPATNFEFKELMSEKEINKAKEKDTSDSEGEKNANAHAKPNGANGGALQKEANKRHVRALKKQFQVNNLK
jgi:hypothetical protein